MNNTCMQPEAFDPDAEIARATQDDRRNQQAYADISRSPDCIKILDLEGRIVHMSRNGLCAMEISDHNDISGKTWWDLWPRDMRDTVKASFDGALQQIDSRFYGSCPTASGNLKDWEVSVRPVMDATLSITSVLSVSRDVTRPAAAP